MDGDLTSPAPATELVGRAVERARIAAALATARSGGADALVLRAEAGMGKSALLREAELQADGLQLLRLTGYAAEAELPYAGLWQLLAPLLSTIEQLPEPQAAALGGALALGEPPGYVDPLAVRGAVAELLALAAAEQPVLVIADDLQWVDGASAQSLLAIARRPPPGAAVLIAVRDGEQLAVDTSGIDAFYLAGLAASDARALVHQRWAELDGAVAEQLVRRTDGNPLALLEIPAALTPEQRAGAAIDGVALALPLGEQLSAAFSAQLRRLPDDVGQVALVAAALGGQPRAILVRAIKRLAIPHAALDEAEAAGLFVAGGGGRLRFRHPLLAAAAYQDRPSHERRAAHAVLAQLSDDPVRAAWHLAAAASGPDGAVASALSDAGQRARERGAHLSAAAAFARAAALSTDPAGRAERELEAARSHAVAGQTGPALDLISEGLGREAAPEIRSQLVRLRAHVALRDGSPTDAERWLAEEADALLAAGQADAAAMCVLESGLTHMVSGHMGALQDAAHRAGALATSNAPELALMAGLIEGEALLAMGRPDEGLALLDAATPIIDGIDPTSEVADAVTMAAQALQWVDAYPRADAILDRIIGGARRAGASGRLAYPLAVAAMLDWRRGELHRSRQTAEEALELAELSRQATIATMACAYLARLAAVRGEADAADQLITRGLAFAADGGGEAVRLHVLAARGFAELTAARPEAAAVTLNEADALSRELAHGEPTLMLFAADHVEALVRTEQRAEAEQATQRLQLAAQQTRSVWTKAVAHRSRMLLVPDDELEREVTLARGWHDQLALPLEQARTELVLGERLRRARLRGEARGPLQSALDGFEALGAVPWADRARRELQTTGAASGAANEALPACELLSTRERQIAQLVAEGRTNREVAVELFLSARTVEHHLTSVYRKLDVSSRIQLAQRITRGA